MQGRELKYPEEKCKKQQQTREPFLEFVRLLRGKKNKNQTVEDTTMKKWMGLNKSAPDETKIETRAPLVLPPDFDELPE